MFLKSITTTGVMLFLALFVTPLLLAQPQAKVDLNKADQKELESLPGIGPTTAQRILEYRQDNGRFAKIEEIMNVWGIGEKKFERLKELITVAAPAPKPEQPNPEQENPNKNDP